MTDLFKIRRYRALEECPQGQRPREVFEATEDAGNILIGVGAAELVPDDTPLGPEQKGYKRRDQRAER